MDKSERRLGNIVKDFANAKNTDEACFKHFENMQDFMSFLDDFADKVKRRFPSLDKINLRSDNEKQILNLTIKQKIIVSELRSELFNLNYELDGFNYENKTVNLLSSYYEGGRFVEGEPDGTIDYSQLPPIGLNEFKKEICDELGGALKSDFFKRMDMAMEIGSDLLELKKGIPDSRFQELSKLSELSGEYQEFIALHDKLYGLQNTIKEILRQIVQGQHYKAIIELPRLVNRYNDQKRSTLKIRANSLFETPLIPSISYLNITSLSDWYSQIYDDLAYCLSQFLKTKGNRDYFRQCAVCGNYFIASKNDKRFKKCKKCTGKTTWTREQQTIAQRERRKKKREKAKQLQLEADIKNLMTELEISREEAIETIEADSEL